MISTNTQKNRSFSPHRRLSGCCPAPIYSFHPDRTPCIPAQLFFQKKLLRHLLHNALTVFGVDHLHILILKLLLQFLLRITEQFQKSLIDFYQGIGFIIQCCCTPQGYLSSSIWYASLCPPHPSFMPTPASSAAEFHLSGIYRRGLLLALHPLLKVPVFDYFNALLRKEASVRLGTRIKTTEILNLFFTFTICMSFLFILSE